jgi:hypothetical protein
MSFMRSLLLEILESRTLLALEASSGEEVVSETSWGDVAVTGAGMVVYGTLGFVIAEGGACPVTKTSALFTGLGLFAGYHVGAGIAHDWLGLGAAPVVD